VGSGRGLDVKQRPAKCWHGEEGRGGMGQRQGGRREEDEEAVRLQALDRWLALGGGARVEHEGEVEDFGAAVIDDDECVGGCGCWGDDDVDLRREI